MRIKNVLNEYKSFKYLHRCLFGFFSRQRIFNEYFAIQAAGAICLQIENTLFIW